MSTPPSTAPSSALLKQGRALVQRLSVLLKTVRLYDGSNVNVVSAARAAAETVRTIHAMESALDLSILLDTLLLNEVRLKTDLAGHRTFRAFMQMLTDRGIGSLRIDADATADDLVRFGQEFHRVDPRSEDPYGEMAEGLRRAGLKTIHVEVLLDMDRSEEDGLLKENLKQRSVKLFFQSIDAARRILSVSDLSKMNFKRAKRVIHRMVDIMGEEESYLLSLTTIKNYDEYTFNHSANVAIYSIAFGQRMGLEKQVLADLGMAALFHDIGKTRVPKEVLNKPGRLDEEEWAVMKAHTVHGAGMLLESRQLTDSVIRNVLVAFEHHLNLDLGGYPTLKDRRDLNLFSRMVSICDCFDALTTPRVYRKVRYAPQEALSLMMEGRGTVFDPVLLKIFVNTVGVYPIGTLVELDTGEMAVVHRTNQAPKQGDAPLVKLFADAAGHPLPEKMIDLSRKDEEGRPLATIVRSVDPADYFDSIEDYLEIL